jgi:hypothetical protein
VVVVCLVVTVRPRMEREGGGKDDAGAAVGLKKIPVRCDARIATRDPVFVLFVDKIYSYSREDYQLLCGGSNSMLGDYDH